MKHIVVFCTMLSCLNATSQLRSHSVLIGKTAGPLPFLEYGLGDDRLGGAKMTFLDTNIVIKVIDSVKDDYKVELSSFHYAWLAKSSFQADTSIHLRPYYLTGSWKVYGDDKYDYLTVALDDRLPYRSLQQINPSRIVIDLFGATSNTNWITQLPTVKEIKNTWYEQIEDDVFRIIIELKHPQHWGYSIFYDDKSLVVRVKRQPSQLAMQNLLVAIDAGHGGTNTGAAGGTSNIMEKDYNLKIAKEVEKYFKSKKVKTFMTRVNDTDLTMIDRTMMLRQQDPHILISIHLNSAGSDTVKGASTYYRYIGFRPLTQFVLKRMRELKLNEWGNVGSFNFSLSGPTEYPNCLLEVAFLSNREDEKKILSPKFHKLVAQKVYLGIDDWLRSLK